MISNPSDRFLLRAALEPPREARECFAQWREMVDLNDVAGTAFRLLPLVYHNVGAILPDDEIKARLRGIARHAWLRSRSRWHLCSAAIERLEQSRIPFMLTKGTALVVALGGVMELRVQSDCDILVEQEHAVEAVGIMLALGMSAWRLGSREFQLEDFRSVHGLDFTRPEDRFGLLDLHWRPLGDVEAPELTTEYFHRSQASTLDGRDVRVPSIEHMFMQAVVHGSKFEEPLRYDWMADCYLMMRLSGERIDWRALWATAERFGLAGLVEESLDLLSDTVVLPIPSRVWRRPTGRVSALERRGMQARIRHPVERSRTDWLLLEWQRLHRADARLSCRPLEACLPALRSRLRSSELPEAEDRNPDALLWFISGWSLPEAHGRWTDGLIAVLAVRLPPDASRRLTLRTVSVAPAGQRVPTTRIFAGGRCRAVLRGQEGEPTVADTVLDLSDLEPESDRVVLRFHVTDPHIPARLDRTADPRQLGVLLVSADWVQETGTQDARDDARHPDIALDQPGAAASSDAPDDPEGAVLSDASDQPGATANSNVPDLPPAAVPGDAVRDP